MEFVCGFSLFSHVLGCRMGLSKHDGFRELFAAGCPPPLAGYRMRGAVRQPLGEPPEKYGNEDAAEELLFPVCPASEATCCVLGSGRSGFRKKPHAFSLHSKLCDGSRLARAIN